LEPVLTRAIDWILIRQQYDQMVKYATALRLGIAETESILRRFTRSDLQQPTYKALAELGKAMKTIFLCRYLHSLIYSHVTPYGTFRLDMNERLVIETGIAA
jgi:TnpA family transposase